MDNRYNQAQGIGFLSLLGLAFIILKLCDVIAWPWWIVLTPVWGGAALVIGILLVVFLIAGISIVIEGMIKRK